MRAFKIIFSVGLLLILLADSSCNTKKDCRGRTKHRLSNGVWI